VSAVKGNRERLFQLGLGHVVQDVFHKGDQAFELLDEFLSRDIFLRKFLVAVAHASRVREQGAEKIIGAADYESGLPNDEPFRAALRSHVEFGSNVAKQNSNASNDGELHPLRQVPKWTW
jgi:hypothetical protein